MKKKILLALAIILIGSSGIKVNALTIQDGINEVEIKQPANAKFHNITANGMSDINTTFGQDVPVYEAQISMNTTGYGGAVSYEVEGGFLAGYNYAITTYIGYAYDTLNYYITTNNRYINQNAICNFGFCSGNWNGGYYFSNVKYSRGYTPQLIAIPYGNGLRYSFYATQILYIFTATASAESVLIPFNSNVDTSIRPVYLLGYNIEVLGQNDLVTNASLNTAILNSGLATASSVNQVQSSVNQVQQEVQGTTNAIDNQTAIISQDHTYNNNPSETIQGQSDMNDMTTAEDNLMNNLDFSGASNINVSINPQSSNFIWDIVNRLRQMNPAIVTLMTSILGLGIFKLILNR